MLAQCARTLYGEAMETNELRITVTDSQGVLLDLTTLTRAELAEAQNNPVAAMALLGNLQVGK